MTIVMLKQVNVSEFKAVCLRLLEEVRQTGESIEILKNGKPLAMVSPVKPASARRGYGSMKHTLTEPLGDILTPVMTRDEWEGRSLK